MLWLFRGRRARASPSAFPPLRPPGNTPVPAVLCDFKKVMHSQLTVSLNEKSLLINSFFTGPPP